MKVKMDFITNSSSTGYTLVVHVNSITAREFVDELWNEIKSDFGGYDFNYTKDEIINTLEMSYDYFPAKKGVHEIVFGDEDRNAAGRVFDYCLRDGVHTKKFHVKFRESLR